MMKLVFHKSGNVEPWKQKTRNLFAKFKVFGRGIMKINEKLREPSNTPTAFAKINCLRSVRNKPQRIDVYVNFVCKNFGNQFIIDYKKALCILAKEEQHRTRINEIIEHHILGNDHEIRLNSLELLKLVSESFDAPDAIKKATSMIDVYVKSDAMAKLATENTEEFTQTADLLAEISRSLREKMAIEKPEMAEAV